MLEDCQSICNPSTMYPLFFFANKLVTSKSLLLLIVNL